MRMNRLGLRSGCAFTRVRARTTALFVALLLLGGCHSFGPDSLMGTHPLYNDAINQSINDQFLQNLVRLHYRDPTFFLDVVNVAATLKLDFYGGLDQSTIGMTGTANNILKFSAGTNYTTQPVISYSPMQGEDFVKSLMVPISLQAMFALSNSGWSAVRLYGLIIEHINGLDNAPTASGPRPDVAPEHDAEFNEFLRVLEELRGTRTVFARNLNDPSKSELVITAKFEPQYAAKVDRLKQLLGLNPDLESYKLVTDFTLAGGDTVAISTRPLMSILYYLSHHIDTPKEHLDEGLVRLTRNPNGTPYDWGLSPVGRWFHIKQSQGTPDQAFLRVPYRDRWFYISDRDLDSKATFTLLTQLFRLQAGSAKPIMPTLTLPVK